MGFLEHQWPYTNFQQANYDWIVEAIKKLSVDHNTDPSNFHIYDKVTDMIEDDTLVLGDYAFCAGYYTALDGGGSVFKIGASGDIPLDNLMYAYIIDRRIVSPLQFGAKGNGTDDDTSFLNNMISKLNDNVNIDLCGKTYKVSQQINLKSNMHMFNGTIHNMFIDGDFLSGILFGNNVSNVYLSNINFTTEDISSGYQQSTANVMFTNSSNITVTDCNVTNSSNESAFTFNHCNEIIVKNCVINGYRYSGVSILNGCHNVVVENCYIAGRYPHSGSYTNSYSIMAGYNQYWNNLDRNTKINYLYNEVFDVNSQWECLDAHWSDEVIVKGNVVHGGLIGIAITSGNGGVAGHGCNNVIVEGNYLYASNSTSYTPIACDGDTTSYSTNLIVKNNIINGNGASITTYVMRISNYSNFICSENVSNITTSNNFIRISGNAINGIFCNNECGTALHIVEVGQSNKTVRNIRIFGNRIDGSPITYVLSGVNGYISVLNNKVSANNNGGQVGYVLGNGLNIYPPNSGSYGDMCYDSNGKLYRCTSPNTDSTKATWVEFTFN